MSVMLCIVVAIVSAGLGAAAMAFCRDVLFEDGPKLPAKPDFVLFEHGPVQYMDKCPGCGRHGENLSGSGFCKKPTCCSFQHLHYRCRACGATMVTMSAAQHTEMQEADKAMGAP